MAVPALTANSPTAGSIAWTAFHIQYNGSSYAVNAGNTADVYTYWLYNGGSPSATLSVSNTQPTLGPDDLLLFINKSGVPINVQDAQLVDGDIIVNGTITAAQIAAGTITGNLIQAGTITGSLIGANTIVANNIVNGTITSAQINASDVIANIVDGATITGNTINGATFNGTNWVENASGSFLYSGTPAAGNLIASIAPASGTDAHGNAYNQGIWAYASSGSSMGFLPVGGQAQLNMTPQGAVFTTQDTVMYSGVNNPGLSNESLYLIMSSGKSNGERDTGIVLTGEPADASASENLLVSLGGQDALFIDRNNVQTFSATPLKVYGESWHSLPLVNSWGTTSDGLAHYKLLPDGSVWILAAINSGTSTTIATLPAGYRPPNKTIYMPCQGTGAITTGLFAQITPTGVLSLNTISSVGTVIINFKYPLDGP